MSINGVSARDWRSALESFPLEVIQTQGGEISVRKGGAGPVIVLLHGIGSGSGSWAYQLESLAASYTVLAWDAPGYGDSTHLDIDEPSVEDYTARLTALVNAIGLETFVLVGHSLGALIAGHYAVQHPQRIRGLILGNPAAGHARLAPKERAKRLNSRIKPFAELGPNEYAQKKAANLLVANSSEENLSLVRWNMARLNLDGLTSAAKLLAGGDLCADVMAYDGPAIVLCGDEDKITPPERCREVADAFPGTRPFHLIKRAAHASYIDAPNEFTRHIVEFENSLAD